MSGLTLAALFICLVPRLSCHASQPAYYSAGKSLTPIDFRTDIICLSIVHANISLSVFGYNAVMGNDRETGSFFHNEVLLFCYDNIQVTTAKSGRVMQIYTFVINYLS